MAAARLPPPRVPAPPSHASATAMRPPLSSRTTSNRAPPLPQPTYLIYTMTDVFRQVFEYKTEK